MVRQRFTYRFGRSLGARQFRRGKRKRALTQGEGNIINGSLTVKLQLGMLRYYSLVW